jgi:RNA polymerase sigma factor (sigma-70 family)
VDDRRPARRRVRASGHAGRAHAALDALPEGQARLLRMRALEGRSYAEIARRTGLPLGTVTSRLARGRAALRPSSACRRARRSSDLFRAD